ncbi:hypothetical protein G7Y79_00006g018240 [Physcia stellaris]|nr:hypothetical protein G7Y79_00006g018240 [Physcia stellaris]
MAELTAVAFMIQIADIGFRLSLKLFTFAQTVAKADEAILSTSKDVSLTCSVLKEVGEVLKADESSRTYSASAVGTATAIVTECSDVFKEMEQILVERVPNIKSSCRDKIMTTIALKPWERFKWSTATPDVCANQTALIRDLIRSKEKQVEKYEKLKRSLTDGEDAVLGSLAIPNALSPIPVHHRKAREKFFARTLREKRREDPESPAEFSREEETDLAYASHLSNLFGSLIAQVDIPAYRIGLLSRHRIRLHLHKAQSREFEQLIHLYGVTALEQIYGLQSPREDAEESSAIV